MIYKIIHVTKAEALGKHGVTQVTVKRKAATCTTSTEVIHELALLRQLPEYRKGRLIVET